MENGWDWARPESPPVPRYAVPSRPLTRPHLSSLICQMFWLTSCVYKHPQQVLHKWEFPSFLTSKEGLQVLSLQEWLGLRWKSDTCRNIAKQTRKPVGRTYRCWWWGFPASLWGMLVAVYCRGVYIQMGYSVLSLGIAHSQKSPNP